MSRVRSNSSANATIDIRIVDGGMVIGVDVAGAEMWLATVFETDTVTVVDGAVAGKRVTGVEMAGVVTIAERLPSETSQMVAAGTLDAWLGVDLTTLEVVAAGAFVVFILLDSNRLFRVTLFSVAGGMTNGFG